MHTPVTSIANSVAYPNLPKATDFSNISFIFRFLFIPLPIGVKKTLGAIVIILIPYFFNSLAKGYVIYAIDPLDAA